MSDKASFDAWRLALEKEPPVYDPLKKTVSYDGENSRADYFVQDAVYRFYRYKEPERLAWVIDQGLPELMENEDAREILRRLVTGKPLRGRGHGPTLQRKADEQEQLTFQRVWYYHGQGYPIHVGEGSNANSETVTACQLAAKDAGCDQGTAYKRWKKNGGHNPQGMWLLAAFAAITSGSDAAKENPQGAQNVRSFMARASGTDADKENPQATLNAQTVMALLASGRKDKKPG